MRVHILLAALAALLLGSAAPYEEGIEAAADTSDPIAIVLDQTNVRLVRLCVEKYYWDADVPMCINKEPARIEEWELQGYIRDALGATRYAPLAYLAEVCRLMPERGFAEPRTLDERNAFCDKYLLEPKQAAP